MTLIDQIEAIMRAKPPQFFTAEPFTGVKLIVPESMATDNLKIRQ